MHTYIYFWKNSVMENEKKRKKNVEVKTFELFFFFFFVQAIKNRAIVALNTWINNTNTVVCLRV